MRETVRCLAFTLAFLVFLCAEPPDTLWSETYGGGSHDVAYSVIETQDGGYVIAGLSMSYGSGAQDVYAVKTDDEGTVLWTRTWGGYGMESAHHVSETPDGGLIFACYTESYGSGGKDVYVVRTDADGDTSWTRTYGGPLQDCGYCAIPTGDGGYLVSGYRDGPSGWVKGNLWLLRLDANGDTLWTKAYGGPGEDFGFRICQTPDGEYVITGRNSTGDPGNLWLLRVDTLGDTLWTRVYGGSLIDVGYGVTLTQDGGYAVTGYRDGPGGWTTGDLWLLRTDADGDTSWTKTYGGTGEETGFGIAETPGGGFVISGQTSTYGTGGGDVWLLKTDDQGDTLWTLTFGGYQTDHSLAMDVTGDGSYLVAGYTASFGAGNNDFYLLKTEPDFGVREHGVRPTPSRLNMATILGAPFTVPSDGSHELFDIMGRRVEPNSMGDGVYFLSVDGHYPTKFVIIR
jgi:hypothetical protein